MCRNDNLKKTHKNANNALTRSLTHFFFFLKQFFSNSLFSFRAREGVFVFADPIAHAEAQEDSPGPVVWSPGTNAQAPGLNTAHAVASRAPCPVWFVNARRRKTHQHHTHHHTTTLMHARMCTHTHTDLSTMEQEPGFELRFPDPDNIMDFALIITPQDGMYVGAHFHFTVHVTSDYPFSPPKVHCDTTVLHPVCYFFQPLSWCVFVCCVFHNSHTTRHRTSTWKDTCA